MSVVSLIGYRGSGKSSVARTLADSIGWSMIDVDDEIEKRTRLDIPTIFARDGETGFRKIERETIVDLLSSPEHLVLSLGGGAILDPDTRNDLKQAGPVIWLTASVETLRKRILHHKSQGTSRPSLTGVPPEDEIADVLQARTPLYTEAATHTVSTEWKSVEVITDEVRDAIVDIISGDDTGSSATGDGEETE